ncbi:hypothetical protein [Brevibacillus formosus]|uniref:hypothetical protein n=1 Tax=Brevibacillus formosus TaxID=54913 RepID=UPI003F1E440A
MIVKINGQATWPNDPPLNPAELNFSKWFELPKFEFPNFGDMISSWLTDLGNSLFTQPKDSHQSSKPPASRRTNERPYHHPSCTNDNA